MMREDPHEAGIPPAWAAYSIGLVWWSLPAFVLGERREVSTKGIMDTPSRVRRRHRSWPEALKREIVAASLAPGASVSLVARQYDVNTNLVFTWRGSV
jgi:hypothetical protein